MPAADWRLTLTASIRYDNIQRIETVITSSSPGDRTAAQQKAFELESQAFDSSSSRDEYEHACETACQTQPGPPTPPSLKTSPAIITQKGAGASPGPDIGPYANCTELGEGVTSTVYHSPGTSCPNPMSERGYALKLIHSYPPEPHNPLREIRTLQAVAHESIITLSDSFRAGGGQHVLVFPFKPLSLTQLLDSGGPIPATRIRTITRDILSGLAHLHDKGIMHRDLKPSAILLDGPDGPACLTDFGTVWHPQLSPSAEPPDAKILDIGTGPYRPLDALLGNKSYSTAVDIWSFGVVVSELASLDSHPKPIFDSPPTHEDGSQLGLILSIFRTLGTPTPETWPEAQAFRTTPFGMWRKFERQEDPFVGVRHEFRELISAMLRYESKERLTAEGALKHECLTENP